MRPLLFVVLVACGGCGHASQPAPSGTLVVVVRTGPERVPFHPKVARIQRANAQLAELLGHSIAIEIDGSLLPQTHEGAEDAIARLVEGVVSDLREMDARGRAFANGTFERLTVRYSPAEAAARQDGWRRGEGSKLDPASKTIDAVRAQGDLFEPGIVYSPLVRAASAAAGARYGVLPDALPVSEHRAWYEWNRSSHGSKSVVGSVDPRRVEGMVMLDRLAGSDLALAREVRAWLVTAASDFSSTYHHHQAEVEAAAPDAPFHRAEAAYVAWLRTANLTIEERGELASHLWVIDFRKKEGDRFAPYAYPGLDPMAFSFEAVDAWIAAGHPTGPTTPRLFLDVVAPATLETKQGELRLERHGRSAQSFYAWGLADRTREDAFEKGVLARPDAAFDTAVFANAHTLLRDEGTYLGFLRRFERTPVAWRIGADVHRASEDRPSAALLDESRRLWREVPAARPHALYWFARHTDDRNEVEWPDLVQGSPATDETLSAFLDLGMPAMETLSAAWPGIARSNGRMRIVIAHARPLLGERARGGRGVVAPLVRLARVLCDDARPGELAELHAFARTELAVRPGEGLSDLVLAADPSRCVPSKAGPPSKTGPRSSRARVPGLRSPF